MSDRFILFIYSNITDSVEDESLEFDIEIEVPEDDLEEYEEPDNHLTHLLNLISDSDNKYNRDEIMWYRTAIWDEIY